MAPTIKELKKNWLYKELDDGTVALTGYKGEDEEVIIPEYIGKKPVTVLSGTFATFMPGKKIDSKTQYNMRKITKITLPSTLRKIGDYSFYGCDGLTECIIPNGVKEIGYKAFEGSYEVSSLEKVLIPDSVEKIGGSAFENCTNLKTVLMGNGIKEIGWDAFCNTAIEKIELPGTVKEMPMNLFKACYDLKEIVLKEGIETIDGLLACINIKRIILPESTKTIRSRCFYHCELLRDIYIPETARLDRLSDFSGHEINTFEGCRNLTIHTPIGEYWDATAKRFNIKIDNDYPFVPSDNEVPNGESDVNDNILIIDDGMTTIPDGWIVRDKDITELILGKGISELPSFKDFKTLKRIEIRGNVKNIKGSNFEGCELLEEIVLPESITFIGMWAFKNCVSLKKINIPSTIEVIGRGAFENCGSLHGINIPVHIDPVGLGLEAAKGLADADGKIVINHHLIAYFGKEEEVTIGPEYIKINQWAFKNSSIKKAVFSEEAFDINGFRDCDSLETAVINKESDILYSGFSNCKNLKNVRFNAECKELSDTFKNCVNLRSITLPNNTESLCETFKGCFKLEEINLPGKKKRINIETFMGCDSLKTIRISSWDEFWSDWMCFVPESCSVIVTDKEWIPNFEIIRCSDFKSKCVKQILLLLLNGIGQQPEKLADYIIKEAKKTKSGKIAKKLENI